MELILNDNVAKLGGIGEIVKVKAGYARNYLIPKGLAVAVTRSNKLAIERHLKGLEKVKKEMLEKAKSLASLIEKTSVSVTKQVGENEKIFGSVTTAELEELLANEGVKVSKKDIELVEDIKKVGVYKGLVRLHPEVKAEFKIWVVAQASS